METTTQQVKVTVTVTRSVRIKTEAGKVDISREEALELIRKLKIAVNVLDYKCSDELLN